MTAAVSLPPALFASNQNTDIVVASRHPPHTHTPSHARQARDATLRRDGKKKTRLKTYELLDYLVQIFCSVVEGTAVVSGVPTIHGTNLLAFRFAPRFRLLLYAFISAFISRNDGKSPSKSCKDSLDT